MKIMLEIVQLDFLCIMTMQMILLLTVKIILQHFRRERARKEQYWAQRKERIGPEDGNLPDKGSQSFKRLLLDKFGLGEIRSPEPKQPRNDDNNKFIVHDDSGRIDCYPLNNMKQMQKQEYKSSCKVVKSKLVMDSP